MDVQGELGEQTSITACLSLFVISWCICVQAPAKDWAQDVKREMGTCIFWVQDHRKPSNNGTVVTLPDNQLIKERNFGQEFNSYSRAPGLVHRSSYRLQPGHKFWLHSCLNSDVGIGWSHMQKGKLLNLLMSSQASLLVLRMYLQNILLCSLFIYFSHTPKRMWSLPTLRQLIKTRGLHVLLRYSPISGYSYVSWY